MRASQHSLARRPRLRRGRTAAVKVCQTCQARFDLSAWRCPACGATPPRRSGYTSFVDAAASGFDDELFEALERSEQRLFWFRSRNRLIVWALQKYFPAARTLLEVGCGTGFVLHAVRRACPRLEITGAELSRAGLDVAAQRLPGVELLQLDARNLPFDDEFDVVGAFDVLEHIEEDEEVLASIYRATRAGGGVLLTVPQHPRLWSAFDDYSHHRRRYTRSELVAKVERAGFRVVRATSFVSLLLPALVVSRLARRQPVDRYDPLAAATMPPALDAALDRVMDGERELIRRGVSFPAGGSLLVVAVRRR